MITNKYLEKDWYFYLKNKYKLCDDDMEEFIDSFKSINKGNIITQKVLCDFLNNEINNNDKCCKKECLQIIRKINFMINGKEKDIIDLLTYLLYIIPICKEHMISNIGVRRLFDSLDTDHDGKIKSHDLISVLYKINTNFSPNDLIKYKKEIKKVCKKVDANNDGFISFDEFKNFMDSISIINHR